MKKNLPAIILCVTLLMTLLMHWEVFTLPIQGKDTWRQSKTAWNIRFFVREDANIFNPRRPFMNEENNIERYELPLMQWPIAMVEKIVGEHIIVKRLAVFLISLLTLLAVYRLTQLLSRDDLVAAVTTFCFAFLPTFFYNATNIMPDILALCFGMYYVLYFFRHLQSGSRKDLWLTALFISLAGLAKLPFILLGIFSIIHAVQLWRAKDSHQASSKWLFIVAHILALVPVITWYAIAIPDWKGNNIATGIASGFVGWKLYYAYFENQVFNIFPTEIFNFPGLVLFFTGVAAIMVSRQLFFTKPVYFFIPWGLLILYFLYILNVIKEGHDYYQMPFYPVFVLALAAGVQALLTSEKKFRALLVILMVLMPITCWWRVNHYWEIRFAYMNPSFFECREQFSTIGNHDETAIIINDESLAVFSYAIDKRSYTFWNDHLPVLWIKDMVKRLGVPYLYSDSRAIESQEGFNDVIESVILECGNIKVFRLKKPEEIRIE